MKKELIKVSNLNVVYDVSYYGSSQSSVRDIVTSFGKKRLLNNNRKRKLHLLKNINLTVCEGEIVGLLGVNGSGKTTLCRHIAGLDGSTGFYNGKIKSIFNTVIGILPELTGKENAEVLVELLYGDLHKETKQKIVESSLKFSEIGDFANAPFKTYSKGMKARVFLSVVSSLPSDILILDEVFDGADIFFNKKITARVKTMIQTSGCVLFVSHELEKIKDICNRGIVLKDGKVGFDGGIGEAVEWYENNCQSSETDE